MGIWTLISFILSSWAFSYLVYNIFGFELSVLFAISYCTGMMMIGFKAIEKAIKEKSENTIL